jgi:ABC-type uncharacterized transport system permease subunit
MERWLLGSSIACFAASFLYSVVSLAARRYRASRRNYALIAAGFVSLTGFLHLRGEASGHCPITTPFEILMFLAWSVALIYLVVGTGFRMSLLGAFTAPLAVLLQTSAFLFQNEPAAHRSAPPNVWLELHAVFSIIAYGAFAMAAVAGLMFLIQESRLKSHKVTGLTAHLPAIRDLRAMNARLMLFGFLLLSAGLIAGFLIGRPAGMLKLAGGVVVWILYGVILRSHWASQCAPTASAKLSIAGFAASLLSLWGTQLMQSGGVLQ